MELTKEYFETYLEQKLSELPTKDEFRALKSSVDEIKDTLTELNKRDLEDSNALSKDYVKLDKRVNKIEKHLNLRPAA